MKSKTNSDRKPISGSGQRMTKKHTQGAVVFYETPLLIGSSLFIVLSLSVSLSLSLSLYLSLQGMSSPWRTCASWLRPCSCSRRRCGRWCSRAWWTTMGCWRSLSPWWRSWSPSWWATARGPSSSWDSGPGWESRSCPRGWADRDPVQLCLCCCCCCCWLNRFRSKAETFINAIFFLFFIGAYCSYIPPLHKFHWV